MTGNNDLFQFAVTAFYSALSDTVTHGGLTRELLRGRRAAHYQNFATMYLVFLAQLIERQGYEMFDFEYEGTTLKDIVAFTVGLYDDLSVLETLEVTTKQDMAFLKDDQYLTWMEVYLTHIKDPHIESIVSKLRPTRNRSLGGYATLYFYEE